MDFFTEMQARIDALFADLAGPRADGAAPSAERVLEWARRGASDPDGLSRAEISAICSALVVHYAQMGIG